MEDCELENCEMSKPHPLCRRCFPVRVKCKTCGHVHDFQPGDVERGDIYVMDVPPEEWICPHCEARMMGVFDQRVDITKQSTLEGLFG
jgi:rubredoxin